MLVIGGSLSQVGGANLVDTEVGNKFHALIELARFGDRNRRQLRLDAIVPAALAFASTPAAALADADAKDARDAVAARDRLEAESEYLAPQVALEDEHGHAVDDDTGDHLDAQQREGGHVAEKR